mmetsp:Transcript_22393/g.37951  ORF Transcript_22393/g.37951 Transcript_22393/m.37951 type:complete len:277 (-) Transcript_22393:36-866(-)
MASKGSKIFKENLFENQVVLVTGGGSGIGQAIAIHLASLGAKVAICGRREEPLIETMKILNSDKSKTFYKTCDIRNFTQVEALMKAIVAKFGRLDVLINNAGGQFPSAAELISPKGFAAVVNNNLNGTWNMILAAARVAFIRQKSGRIVNIIANVKRGFPSMVHTGAARAGVDNLTKTLAIEWARHNITINSVAPGIIDSSGTRDAKRYNQKMMKAAQESIPMGRVGTVDEVADITLFLASDQCASYINGQTVYIDGAQSLAGDMWSNIEDIIPKL